MQEDSARSEAETQAETVQNDPAPGAIIDRISQQEQEEEEKERQKDEERVRKIKTAEHSARLAAS